MSSISLLPERGRFSVGDPARPGALRSVAVGAVFCDGVVGANRLSPLPPAIAGPTGWSACAGFAAPMTRQFGFR
jgi:hypothetical protein